MTELIYAPQNLWTTHHEKLLLKWRTEAIGFEWKHKRTAELYENLNYVFGFISILLTIITGASFFVDLNNDASCSGDLYKKVGFGVVMIIATITTSINTLFKYNEWSEKHKNCADKWRNYVNNIDTELSFSKEERINGKIFMKQMQKRYNELTEICPNIPKFIQKKYDTEAIKKKLHELNEVIIDETFVKYTQPSTTKNADDSSTDDDTNKSPDIQRELENEMKGKQIKENITKYISDNSERPISRLINL